MQFNSHFNNFKDIGIVSQRNLQFLNENVEDFEVTFAAFPLRRLRQP